MVPRFITPLEDEYNKLFPGNPATLFYVTYPEEEHKAFVDMLQRAIDTKTPIEESDIIALLGEDAYRWGLEYMKDWGAEVRWK